VTSPPARSQKPLSTSPRKARPGEAPRLRRLRLAELPADSVSLAKYLIGAVLVSDAAGGRTAIRIVETEAYLPGDPACHAYRRETVRNATLFRRRGHAYVYFIYGMYHCVNVSSEIEGVGAGVLIRAGEPLVGLDVMRARRPRSTLRDLTRGPARLASALGIVPSDDGLDLCAPGRLWLAAHPVPARFPHGESVRIGITKGADRELRFFERGSSYLSGPAALNA
jgi:DNA-3-methyladenine glycosylase